MNDELNNEQISALLALMGAAREIDNNELEELAGFRIDGGLRRTLNDRHLVTSTRTGNKPYTHDLTDAGWKRCEAELAGGPLKGTKHLAGAFRMVLDGLGRHLHTKNKALADIFEPEDTPEPVTDEQITDVYRQLAKKQGAWVRLADLRPLLNGAKKADVDRVLKEMSKAKRAHLSPNHDPKLVTAADRAAAIRIDNEDTHLLVVEQS
jgi:hypothetical protein